MWVVKADCQIISAIIHTVADYYQDYISQYKATVIGICCIGSAHTVAHGGSPYGLLISTQMPESLVEDSDLL